MAWVIDVVTHRDGPPGVPQLTYGRLVGLPGDLPPGLRVGDRFGPVAAADRNGELWHVSVAVVVGVTGPRAGAATVGPFRRASGLPILTLAEPDRRPRRVRRRPWVPSPN